MAVLHVAAGVVVEGEIRLLEEAEVADGGNEVDTDSPVEGEQNPKVGSPGEVLAAGVDQVDQHRLGT